MKLVTFRHGGSGAQAGILNGDKVTGLGTDMLRLIFLGTIPAPVGESYDLSTVTLLAPIPRPPKFICVGLNYRDHAIESGLPIPEIPIVFSKFSNAVIGPGDRHAGRSVRMRHAVDVAPCHVNGAVNDEAGGVDAIIRGVEQHVAVEVDLDQAGGVDFLVQHPVRVDQEVVVRAGDPA